MVGLNHSQFKTKKSLVLNLFLDITELSILWGLGIDGRTTNIIGYFKFNINYCNYSLPILLSDISI